MRHCGSLMSSLPLPRALSGISLAALVFTSACGAAPTAPASSAAPNTASSGAAKPSAAAGSVQAKPSGAALSGDQLVAAAKAEGKVSVIVPPGDSYRQMYDAFQQTYGITVELLPVQGTAEVTPKLKAERDAGQYNWDFIMHSPLALFLGMKPIGALDPLRPILTPEVLDDSKWLGGFNAGWADKDRALDYSFVADFEPIVYVNRSVLSEAQFNSVDQLWDPQWKGKIAMDDPRVPSVGLTSAANFLVTRSEEKLRSLFQNQQLVLTQDRRQLAEFVVRGQYPIALGVQNAVQADLQAQGLSMDQVKPLLGDDPAIGFVSSTTGALGLFNRAPHPNAAKLLINWVLSQDGQAQFTQRTNWHVRRLDVTGNKGLGPDPKKEYPNLQIEDAQPTLNKANAIAKELLK